MNVSIDGFSEEVRKMLENYSEECTEVVQKAVQKSANKAVKELKNNSPKKTGKYSKSWKKKIEKNKVGASATVYNTRYYLTHLLENGHANRDGGRTPAKPHIGQVNNSIQQEFVDEIEKGISKIQ